MLDGTDPAAQVVVSAWVGASEALAVMKDKGTAVGLVARRVTEGEGRVEVVVVNGGTPPPGGGGVPPGGGVVPGGGGAAGGAAAVVVGAGETGPGAPVT